MDVVTGIRGRFFAAWVVVVALLSPAAAGAKRGGGGDELLDVVVLPFAALSGRKAQADAKEALELELELVDNVRVQASEAIEQDLSALGDDAFEPKALSGVLKRRGVEVLIAGPAGLGRAVVVAFAADGQPRVVKDLPRGAAADQLAATTMAALKPALSRWAKQKPLALPAGGAGAGRGGVDEEDVLAEADRPKKPARADDDEPPRKPRERDAGRGGRGVDDDEEDAPKVAQRGDRHDRARRGDDVAAPRVREEASTRERAALDAGDDDTLGQREHRSLTEVEDEAPAGGGPVKATHLIAMSGAFEGATWRYTLDTDDRIGPKPVVAGFFPGGAVRFDLWPWEFAGLDATATVANVPFVIPPVRDQAGNIVLQINPGDFSAIQVNIGGALRGRWMLRFGDDGPLRMVGLGARLGYRYWSASTETQLIAGTQTLLTIVPGFRFHGLAIGPELYLPVFVADRRFEFELKVDTIPLTFYGETPDNPGASSLAFGYNAELVARFDVLSGVFLEASGKSTGATINFEGDGNRVTLVTSDSAPVRLHGGRALSFAAGFTVGLGFMY